MNIQDMTTGRQGFKPTKQELGEWLDKQILCTIATIDEEAFPNTATVAFSQSTALEFVIITDTNSRKAVNIHRNNKVALTITNENDRYTLQLEGRATELSWDEFKIFEKYHYEKLPFSLPFKDIPGQSPFIIRPTHLRFGDISVRPWEYTEYDV